MKKSIFLWCSILLLQPVFGQTSLNKPDSVYYLSANDCWIINQIDKYTYSGNTSTKLTRFTLNKGTGELDSNAVVYFTYDNTGKLIEKLEDFTLPYLTDYKYEYVYTANDSIQKYTMYKQTASGWGIVFVDSTSYNEQGYKGDRIASIPTGDVLQKNSYYSWIYSEDGKVTAEIQGEYINGDRVLKSKTSYKYSGNMLSEVVGYYWPIQGGDSVNLTRILYSYSNSKPIKTEYFNWNSNSITWKINTVDEFSYDASGNRKQIVHYKYLNIQENALALTKEIINLDENNKVYDDIQYRWIFHAWTKKSRIVTFSQNAKIKINNSDLCGSNIYEVKMDAECTADLQENAADKMFVFPNPSDGKITVSLTEGFKNNFTVKVLSLEGKTVFNQNYIFDPSQREQTLQLDNLNTGLYFIQIISNNKVYQEKVVIDIQ